MNITRNRNKYMDEKTDTKIPLVFDIRMLDSICKYVLSDIKRVKKYHLLNIRNLLKNINYDSFINDVEKNERINFIEYALNAKLDLHLRDYNLIIQSILSNFDHSINFINFNDIYLSDNEINWITDTITECLNYSFIFNQIDKMQDICARFKTTEFRYRGDIVKEYEELIDKSKNQFRQNKIDNVGDMTFSLKDGVFEDVITDTYNIITNPSRRLITGMQGLNLLLAGGFESGRVYMFLGEAGVGKSVTLLNLIYQMKKANFNYKPKDPKKIPCIVMLTMENTIVETITRLFDLINNDSTPMNNYNNPNEIIDILRHKGQLSVSDNSPIDMVIKYKPNKSINTGWLYAMVDDLEDSGYEVIGVIQDHIKRINSINHYSDYRLELGEIVNEFKVFAAEKDIPIITVSHLNRDASKTTETAIQGNKVDITKMLGKSNVGESMLMIDNLDLGAIINVEYDKDGNRYMVFKVVKDRINSKLLYFAQPFDQISRIRLIEDLYTNPIYKVSLYAKSELQFEKRQPERQINNNFQFNNSGSSIYNTDILKSVVQPSLQNQPNKNTISLKSIYDNQNNTIPSYDMQNNLPYQQQKLFYLYPNGFNVIDYYGQPDYYDENV